MAEHELNKERVKKFMVLTIPFVITKNSSNRYTVFIIFYKYLEM